MEGVSFIFSPMRASPWPVRMHLTEGETPALASGPEETPKEGRVELRWKISGTLKKCLLSAMCHLKPQPDPEELDPSLSPLSVSIGLFLRAGNDMVSVLVNEGQSLLA